MARAFRFTSPVVGPPLLRRAAALFRERGDLDGELGSVVHLGHLAWIRHDRAELTSALTRGLELEAAGSTWETYQRRRGS
jgi:hypothetical protein